MPLRGATVGIWTFVRENANARSAFAWAQAPLHRELGRSLCVAAWPPHRHVTRGGLRQTGGVG